MFLKKIFLSFFKLCFRIPFSKPFFRKLYSELIHQDNNQSFFSNYRIHEFMLADKTRLEIYRKAISKYVNNNITAVDVGTGTGVLSYFMLKQKPRKIYAIDHSSIINTAKLLSEKNNISGISFIKKNSKKFFPREKVDIIFHELIGNGLINEGMIETLLDLRDRILSREGQIFPSKFALYLEPTLLKEDSKKPYLWDHNFANINYSYLQSFIPELEEKRLFFINFNEIEQLLSIPKPIYSFDLMKLGRNEFPNEIYFKKEIKNSSIFEGLSLFFSVKFDEEIKFSTFPNEPLTLWKKQVPFFRFQSCYLQEKEILNFSLRIKDPHKIFTWEINQI